MTRHTALWLSAVLCGGQAVTLAAQPAASPATPLATKTATFSMYCYWTGEATLGKTPGVVATRIGELGGNEVVEVSYDPAKTDVARLAEALKQQNSFYALIAPGPEAAKKSGLPVSEVKVRSGRPDYVESKHSLRVVHPELYYLDLTEAQAMALDSWSFFGGSMPAVLTPEQLQTAAKIKTRLAHGRAPGEPSRSGPEREEYRKTLVAWLGK
jgi:hypothetical protein